MIFTENLEERIFHAHKDFIATDLIIISGYIGPNPILRLSTLPLNTTVIYGMYSTNSISTQLHNCLLNIDSNFSNIQIQYSNIPVHSKCYVWIDHGQIVYALIGSANFSFNGLNVPFKEILSEVTPDSFQFLCDYLKQIIQNSISCSSGIPKINFKNHQITQNNSLIQVNQLSISNSTSCQMTLIDPKTGDVQPASGLNWGQGNGNVRLNDSCIPIRTEHIRNFPVMFPPKQSTKTPKGQIKHTPDPIELVWDDGIIMTALLEGSQPVDNIQYPKQIGSLPHKDVLGIYLRNRLGIPLDSPIIKADLDRYGRDNIDVTLLQERVYYLDFSI